MIECLRLIRTELRAGNNRPVASDAPPQPGSETYLTLLFECARLLARRFDTRLADIGHTRAQWLVLNTVSRREGLRQTEIADITEIAVAPLGRILDVLEKGGWIERRPDAKDRRANRLHITRRASHMLTGMRARFETLHESLVRPLGEERRKLLVDRLGWIRHRLLEESAHAVETRRANTKA